MKKPSWKLLKQLALWGLAEGIIKASRYCLLFVESCKKTVSRSGALHRASWTFRMVFLVEIFIHANWKIDFVWSNNGGIMALVGVVCLPVILLMDADFNAWVGKRHAWMDKKMDSIIAIWLVVGILLVVSGAGTLILVAMVEAFAVFCISLVAIGLFALHAYFLPTKMLLWLSKNSVSVINFSADMDIDAKLLAKAGDDISRYGKSIRMALFMGKPDREENNFSL